MKKSDIKRTIREINSKVLNLTLEKTLIILAKPLEFDDSEEREFDSKIWAIDSHIHKLRGQKRALMNIIGAL